MLIMPCSNITFTGVKSLGKNGVHLIEWGLFYAVLQLSDLDLNFASLWKIHGIDGPKDTVLIYGVDRLRHNLPQFLGASQNISDLFIVSLVMFLIVMRLKTRENIEITQETVSSQDKRPHQKQDARRPPPGVFGWGRVGAGDNGPAGATCADFNKIKLR
jgi:hypothetical protein